MASCRAGVTLSRRCATPLAIVSSWPVLLACAVATECKSRRNSFICDSIASLFCRLCELCKISQRTSTATKITTPIRATFIRSPMRPAETVSLLYSQYFALQNSLQKQRGPRGGPLYFELSTVDGGLSFWLP